MNNEPCKDCTGKDCECDKVLEVDAFDREIALLETYKGRYDFQRVRGAIKASHEALRTQRDDLLKQVSEQETELKQHREQRDEHTQVKDAQ